MDSGIEIISTLISNLGFPIAMCVILFYSLNQERKDHRASEISDGKKWTNVSLLDMIDYTNQNNHNKDEANAHWLIESIRGLLDKLEACI